MDVRVLFPALRKLKSLISVDEGYTIGAFALKLSITNEYNDDATSVYTQTKDFSRSTGRKTITCGGVALP